MDVPFDVDLKDKTALVTGGGGILCGCMSQALARCGARVAVADLRAEAAEAVAAGIKDGGGKAMGVACDVLKRESLEAARASVAREFGPVDILINGAGGNHPKGTTGKEHLEAADLAAAQEGLTTFFDLDPDGFAFVFNLNFLGTLLPTQVFAQDMVGDGGTIINISSMAAFVPLTKVPAYSAAKAAVSNFTQWLAVHMAKVGIRVNAIAPGFFLTDQNRSLLTNEDGSTTPRGEKIISQTPQGRYGDPTELVGTLLWLVSERASGFVTGAVIPVDGGFSAYSGV
jgi:NAD(P)-dependent dehydrogenase (short-subunit alcohol dehydrogenase family)